MSVRIDYQSYKLFEPDYHPQRPIIVGVDAGLESPETATLRYEEAAARANAGGDLHVDSPPALLPMSAYGKPQPSQLHGYDSPRGYQDPASFTQYDARAFPSQPGEGAAHINQENFVASNAVTDFVTGGQSIQVVSCNPATGSFGTKVHLQVLSQSDLLAITSTYIWLAFGLQKCPVDTLRESQDGKGSYTMTVQAPQHSVTGCQTASVPLSLVIESQTGDEISRTAAGHFVYADAPADGTPASPEGVTRPKTKSPEQHPGSPVKPAAVSPSEMAAAAAAAAAAVAATGPVVVTNTYTYPVSAEAPQQSPYSNPYPPTSDGEMITYSKSASFSDYPRLAPPPLRSPANGWPAYGLHPRSPIISHRTGPSLATPLPAPVTSVPRLMRTSTIPSPGGGPGYSSYGIYSNKAQLKIHGDLNSMAENWTQEEWDNRRRIVLFSRKQHGSTLTVNFRAVDVNNRPPQSVCVSCIWWAEKKACYVTSVDTINLLEQLLTAPSRFTVEEKNRIRRNLEGFRPLTVSKAKPESEEFFKLIMSFPNPKPRNIEKDVKVFPWKVLEQALSKIISKYSATPASTMPITHVLPPATAVGYPSLPTPTSIVLPPESSPPYGLPPAHHEAVVSPRSINGTPSIYSSYTQRTLSPVGRSSSPLMSVLRPIPAALPPVVSTYDSRTMTTSSYSAGIHAPISHAHTSRWEAPPPAYAETYQGLSPHHHPSPTHHQHHVYGQAYESGAPRA